ncbi:hypothetical protein ACFXKH_38400 [Streptomyces caelestis]|uniref:hypothetical protein n=1 Tax=Streptomyces caelestis TaxID=36816 RepID=UPI0036A7BD60
MTRLLIEVVHERVIVGGWSGSRTRSLHRVRQGGRLTTKPREAVEARGLTPRRLGGPTCVIPIAVKQHDAHFATRALEPAKTTPKILQPLAVSVVLMGSLQPLAER